MGRKRESYPSNKCNSLSLAEPLKEGSPRLSWRSEYALVLKEDYDELIKEFKPLEKAVRAHEDKVWNTDTSFYKDGGDLYERVLFNTGKLSTIDKLRKAVAWAEEHPDFAVLYNYDDSYEWYAYVPLSDERRAAIDKLNEADAALVERVKAYMGKYRAAVKRYQRKRDKEAKAAAEAAEAAEAARVAERANGQDAEVLEAIELLRKRGVTVTFNIEGAK